MQARRLVQQLRVAHQESLKAGAAASCIQVRLPAPTTSRYTLHTKHPHSRQACRGCMLALLQQGLLEVSWGCEMGGRGGADCLEAAATPHLFPQRYCSLALAAVQVCSGACSCVRSCGLHAAARRLS